MEKFTKSLVDVIAVGTTAAMNDAGYRDPYRALRAYITNKYPRIGLEILEADPCSISGKAAIQLELELAGAANDTALLWLVAGVWKELEGEMSDYAKMADLDIDEISEALKLQIRRMPTGFTSKNAEHFPEYRHLN